MAQEMVSLQPVEKEEDPRIPAVAEAKGDDDDPQDSFVDEAEPNHNNDSNRHTFERMRLWRSILVWTIALEGLTCIMRFGFGMQSTRDTASTVGRLTGGIRIHHGYLGVLLLILSRCCGLERHRWMTVGGWSLIASDLAHHFLVLWPVTGSPQFDLTYPN